jgi:Domain of unknown function (DUF4864)
MRTAELIGSRRAALCALGALLVLPLARASDDINGLARRDWDAIRKVIRDQLAALRRGDGKHAFAHATSALQRQFIDADTFMRMVHDGYGALLTARYTEFLDGAVIDGETIQPLRLVLPDNSVLVTLYTMQREGTRWRIAGCVLAASTVKAA